ncbi:MAG: hypothetical protein A3G34_17380 [Candidatus Lindowbacteria bacterium RIFCSPLOWO2_12_FULL_62_27]|nr:MAG: hypothetical protein A3G34_17380 [Candidatus Lindowbacteria bacterium RIFCSPLOWO2_12_FULL_62_27]OGH62180.1 MAG: hypothetical protein A3I06_01360 [Candidatus Lindowbacteria bacterium RIFCSPLOWO2_02_FULL_62_12]
MKDVLSRVIRNKKVSGAYHVLTLDAGVFPEIRPGQFLQVLCHNGHDTEPFLRRPFSVMDVRGRRIDILYKVIGPGTVRMAQFRPGERISILGPCGNTFSLDVDAADSVLVVAGGTGLGGVYYLIRRLKEMNVRQTVLYGVRSARDVAGGLLRNLRVGAQIVVEETDGLVTERVANLPLQRYRRCFVCGPTGMIRAVAELARGRIPEIEVSLEEMMGCGFGICYTCPVKKRHGDGYFRACDEGPVFREELISLGDSNGRQTR